jgi:hypothetical protein
MAYKYRSVEELSKIFCYILTGVTKHFLPSSCLLPYKPNNISNITLHVLHRLFMFPSMYTLRVATGVAWNTAV